MREFLWALVISETETAQFCNVPPFERYTQSDTDTQHFRLAGNRLLSYNGAFSRMQMDLLLDQGRKEGRANRTAIMMTNLQQQLYFVTTKIF